LKDKKVIPKQQRKIPIKLTSPRLSFKNLFAKIQLQIMLVVASKGYPIDNGKFLRAVLKINRLQKYAKPPSKNNRNASLLELLEEYFITRLPIAENNDAKNIKTYITTKDLKNDPSTSILLVS
tara:strand:+ start:53 stop:421 length:369 start_codon:yes stop_codon:yes gene_type:complete